MIKVGSLWVGSTHIPFKVRAIEEQEDGVWVSYGHEGEDRTYECLIGAFLQRFTELLV